MTFRRVWWLVLIAAGWLAAATAFTQSPPRQISTPDAPTASAAPTSTAVPAPMRVPRVDVYAATGSGAVLRGSEASPSGSTCRTMANSVDVIDPATFQVVGHFPVGRSPQHITPSWNLTHLYVNNTSGNSLTVVDPHSARPTDTIPVADPYNLYFTLDGEKAIVVAERLHEMDFRDPHTWALIKSVPIPFDAGVPRLLTESTRVLLFTRKRKTPGE